MSGERWFRLHAKTVGLAGGFTYRQPYEYSRACTTCGAGALPVGALVAQLSKMGKKLLDRTAHDGHIVVTAALADAVLRERMTGVEVRPVRRPQVETPDSGYRWLHIVSQWPRMASTSVVTVDDLCPQCHRTGHFDLGTRLGEWHYQRPPAATADFNYTCERFGYWRGKGWELGLRGVGAAGGIIVSLRARELLDSLKVRHIEYVPVVFDEGAQQGADERRPC